MQEYMAATSLSVWFHVSSSVSDIAARSYFIAANLATRELIPGQHFTLDYIYSGFILLFINHLVINIKVVTIKTYYKTYNSLFEIQQRKNKLMSVCIYIHSFDTVQGILDNIVICNCADPLSGHTENESKPVTHCIMYV